MDLDIDKISEQLKSESIPLPEGLTSSEIHEWMRTKRIERRVVRQSSDNNQRK